MTLNQATYSTLFRPSKLQARRVTKTSQLSLLILSGRFGYGALLCSGRSYRTGILHSMFFIRWRIFSYHTSTSLYGRLDPEYAFNLIKT